MLAISIIAYFLTILSLGGLVLRLLQYKQSAGKIYFFALSYGLGSFLVGLQLMILLLVLRLKYSHFLFIGLLLIEILLLLAVNYYFSGNSSGKITMAGIFNGPKHSQDLIWRIIAALIGLQIIFSAVNAVSLPTATYDSLPLWAFRAKQLYYAKQLDFNPGSFYYLGGGWHTNYPWLVPLNIFWFNEMLGEYDDALMNLVFLGYFIAIIILVYGAVNKYSSGRVGIIFAFFASSVPLIFYHSFNAYADLTLAYFVLCAFIFLMSYARENNLNDFILMSIFLGAAFYVKLDALIFFIAAVICMSMMLIAEKSASAFKPILYLVLISAAAGSFWFYYLIKYDLGLSNIGSGLGFHPEIFPKLGATLFLSGNWNIIWYFVVVVLIIWRRAIIKHKELLFGWIFFALAFGGFVCLYLFTDTYRYVLDNTAVSRNLILFVPMALILAGITLYHPPLQKQLIEKERKLI